ncbi:MAG TPA: cytochrome c oxidase subunit II [Vicinamibacterales bacterium]|nr:cytochrome c oxidase subunit II [Vicinamibacterales bacterium]
MSSVLDPAGSGAVEIARLFWAMAAAAAAIWLIVSLLIIHAIRRRKSAWSERAGARLIAIGGGAVPAILLLLLLLSGMPVLSRQIAPAPAGALRVHVVGEQWWWRISYEAGERRVNLANELRLPRGRTTEVVLSSADVIHSFWVPALAGKVDMIPGRTTRLTLEPREAGTFRGACAEYCGASHARMALDVVVMEPDEFEGWILAQEQPAVAAGDPRAFISAGCGGCHTVRGTTARGTIGPDLTHVGSRMSLAAGVLPNSLAELQRWIANPQHIKPGALMPPFGMLPADDVRQVVAYVQALR